MKNTHLQMKISFITTVFNEEKTIESLLNSLFKQTRLPDEVVVVDAGSTDQTIKKIKNQKSKIKNLNFKLIVRKGVNRSEGRNLAIKEACGDIIAVSDAGCILDQSWLEKITEPFQDPLVAVVSGFYRPLAKNLFEKCLSLFTCSLKERVRGGEYLPSSRSIAFRKSAWLKVGGYPEELDYCEDLIFAQKLKKHGFQFHFSPESLVYWPQRKNLLAAFRQFVNYASGDVQAGYQPHLKKISLVFLRYLLAVFLLFCCTRLFLIFLIFYLFYAIIKNFRFVRRPLSLIYLPLLQITADFGVMLGSLKGLISKLFPSPKGYN